MTVVPEEMEERYRRFLDNRGDTVGSLILLLGDERSEQGAARAWAALILSRIFLVEGRMLKAEAYLRMAASLFRSTAGIDMPLALWVNRAVILRDRGFTSQAGNLLVRVFNLALSRGQTQAAAKAAANLAVLYARSGDIRNSDSYLSFAIKSYEGLRLDNEIHRCMPVLSLLDMVRGNHDRAIDRLHLFIRWSEENRLPREKLTGLLLMAESFLAGRDLQNGSAALTGAGSPEGQLEIFRPKKVEHLFLQSLLKGMEGKIEVSRKYRDDGEILRKSLGLRIPPSVAGYGRFFERETGGHREGCAAYRSSRAGYSIDSVNGACRHRFVTRNRRMLDIIDEIRRCSTFPAPILIYGESGVGKEIVCRLIHAWSGRGRQPFVPVNSAALPGHLFESSLFGHSKGAFTGASSKNPGFIESAGEGTIFLDEIGELDLPLQAKLLRLLDTGEFSPVGRSTIKYCRARVVAATNMDLAEAVKSGRFRADLFYRLSALAFSIPPLRERREDIEALAEYFLENLISSNNDIEVSLGISSKRLLMEYSWPGNARELQNEIKSAAMKRGRGIIRVTDFSSNLIGAAFTTVPVGGSSLYRKLEDLERREILEALVESGGNRTRAAEMLGIKRTTLIYRIKKLGIEL